MKYLVINSPFQNLNKGVIVAVETKDYQDSNCKISLSQQSKKKETDKTNIDLVEKIENDPKNEYVFDPHNPACPDCGLVFESPNLFRLHQDMTHKCNLSYGDAHRKDKKWQCPICLKFYLLTYK